jgi:hypothetical protein
MNYYEILMWLQSRLVELSEGFDSLVITYLDDDGVQRISYGYKTLVEFVLSYNKSELTTKE